MKAPGHDDQVRVFVSIGVEGEILKLVEQQQRALQQRLATDSVQWVAPDQLHVTLRFLGNLDRAVLPQVDALLQQVCRDQRSFTVDVEGLGCFPSYREPRIVWLGLTGETRPLLELQARVDASLEGFAGTQEVRRFEPHLTIGRVKRAAQATSRLLGQMLRDIEVPKVGHWHCGAVQLMRSMLSSSGSKYTRLKGFQLRRIEASR